jgi:hypothetical protein
MPVCLSGGEAHRCVDIRRAYFNDPEHAIPDGWPMLCARVLWPSARSINFLPILIAVGTSITGRAPHRSVRADFPHTAPTSGV